MGLEGHNLLARPFHPLPLSRPDPPHSFLFILLAHGHRNSSIAYITPVLLPSQSFPGPHVLLRSQSIVFFRRSRGGFRETPDILALFPLDPPLRGRVDASLLIFFNLCKVIERHFLIFALHYLRPRLVFTWPFLFFFVSSFLIPTYPQVCSLSGM